MPTVDVVVETPVSKSIRARQLEGIFDVPPQEKARLEWKGEIPIEDMRWNVGLIVGPSGCGKTTIARSLYGKAVDAKLKWKSASVIDDFDKSLSIDDISKACQSVGFNTIPAWLRPFSVLSNGEKFRVEVARRMLELDDPIVIDEFTSVVDRQVAQIASHAVQKFVRKNERKLIAVSCHYDIIDWLQPDWIFEPSEMRFTRRLLRRRPELDFTISPISYSAWRVFAPFHYMSADLNRAARCFGLWVNGRLAAFNGVLYRPHPKRKGLYGLSRLVTLPDFQGIGAAFMLTERVASAYVANDKTFRTYPAHPALIRAFAKSDKWRMVKRPGRYSSKAKHSRTSSMPMPDNVGGRPCAVFEYCGEAMDKCDAMRLFAKEPA